VIPAIVHFKCQTETLACSLLRHVTHLTNRPAWSVPWAMSLADASLNSIPSGRFCVDNSCLCGPNSCSQNSVLQKPAPGPPCSGTLRLYALPADVSSNRVAVAAWCLSRTASHFCTLYQRSHGRSLGLPSEDTCRLLQLTK
jgi:hypothetical protein